MYQRQSRKICVEYKHTSSKVPSTDTKIAKTLFVALIYLKPELI